MVPGKMLMAVRWEAQVEKALRPPQAEGILMFVHVFRWDKNDTNSDEAVGGRVMGKRGKNC